MDKVPPIGLLARLLKWFLDFAKMPGRVAEIHASRRREEQRYILCPNCDERMKQHHHAMQPDKGLEIFWYTCPGCDHHTQRMYKAK